MRAFIVGGGIGGLAAAIGLTRAGWQVTVHERAADLARSGTGLGIWPEAVAALDRLGIGDELRKRAKRQPPGSLRRPDGRVIATVDTKRLERRAGEPPYVIARAELLDLLYGALAEGTVRFGTEVTPGAWHGFDLVVGADGAGSRVREALFGAEHRLRDTGFTAWRGVVPLDVERGAETWGIGEKFGYLPLGDGRTNFYAVLPTPARPRPMEDELATLRSRFGHWHDPIPRVLDRIEPDALLRHGLHYLHPPLPSYVSGNVALLGDAAHAMTPDLGQGACQSLIDGLILGESLAGTTDVHSGLRAYDRARRRPSQRIAAAARQLGRISVASRALVLRDAAVRLAVAFDSVRSRGT
ncbi:2-polyprenyl-6-methoxyphenol hydroxylase-like FAD-dependent oxidoreductase [Saccharomonospora amisosensis]|uniref:2-polyprenyl-6-methoxyphenol hydroxylase-like FAD-dependent oxidoreductase n=1 Tax=Saccharomonospora amisosensis TaxID=1128677 RepID=A0A7X5ZSB9_9PSEU|nr:FAD-dependent monooxygenase [Saccharomonospora amisosensis]NIJ13752.1 2-polyprenyl-6-methoxyphenol hydroxylase-like FAD-dependent oxidoreductase [Saccharomonospora amisosensis]